ncbi:SNF2-related protein, partial [Bacillus pumilus]|uniref:SNF2-related protein n=1 Tax=Bacillus pumilus TaxID=1408 RepID=UPI0034D9675D
MSLHEPQNINNPHTKQSTAITHLKPHHHIPLTPTPIQNPLTHLSSIFHFLNKPYLPTFTTFHNKFLLPIQKHPHQKTIQHLHHLIKPFLLTPTNQHQHLALNFPHKLQQKQFIPLSPHHPSLYQHLLKHTFQHIPSLTPIHPKAIILTILPILEQICHHRAL